jgi:hypothetical protein
MYYRVLRVLAPNLVWYATKSMPMKVSNRRKTTTEIRDPTIAKTSEMIQPNAIF